MSKGTTVAKFREKLSSWLDTAKKGPIFINRGEERFALMDESFYREIEQKITDLQSSLIAALADDESEVASKFDEGVLKAKKYQRKEA